MFLRDGEVDFTDSEGQDWKMILVLLERERPSSKFSANMDTSKWVLETFKAELKEDHPMENVAWLLTFALESRELTQRILDSRELPRYDTPTSLAMRRSAFFFKWRQMIKDLSCDLKVFIEEELEQSPADAGWTKDRSLPYSNANILRWI
ncbi:hypothetical protein BP6252_13278 [Coleophoma cylindrospora]|uniref:Uncharacterized protein n=1 Tax=Coleophoma cylindrospora TaxID=1849047 RepID=A0A3D8QAC5_9HELO|nr:hypothetical protein BP6252_13278 [Coleophoma cylindrospora]